MNPPVDNTSVTTPLSSTRYNLAADAEVTVGGKADPLSVVEAERERLKRLMRERCHERQPYYPGRKLVKSSLSLATRWRASRGTPVIFYNHPIDVVTTQVVSSPSCASRFEWPTSAMTWRLGGSSAG